MSQVRSLGTSGVLRSSPEARSASVTKKELNGWDVGEGFCKEKAVGVIQ